MHFSRSTLTNAALLVLQSLSCLARSQRSGSRNAIQYLQPRAAPARLDPVHPTILRDAEGRHNRLAKGAGDYIMKGLSGTMDMVDQEYGLRDSESFYWGPSGNPIANLTAYADGKAVRVLSLERFDNVLEKAECALDNVKLTFTKEVQFDAVQTAWKWVNDAEGNYIVLVTESAQCNVADGDETIRQPWHVTKAIFDDDTNVVTLTAEPKTWSEAFSNWHLKVRSRGLLPPQQQSPRGIIDKRIEIKGSPKIDLSMDFSNSSMTLSASDDGASVSASMTCTQCETHGSLDFDIDIIPYLCEGVKCLYDWDPHLEGHIQVVADGIGATVEIKTTVSAAATLAKDREEIFRWAPSVGRIYIPGVLDLGPELKFLIASDLGKVGGKLDLKTGLHLDIPDNAIYYLDVGDSANNQVSDWTPQITPLEPQASGTVSLSASIGGELHLDFAGKVMGIAAAEIGVYLAAPTFNIKASMFEQTGGACNIPDADAGVNLDVGVGMSLDAYEQAELALAGHVVAHAGATQTIWSISTALYTTCVTLDAEPQVTSSASAAMPTPAPAGVSYYAQNGTTTCYEPYPTAAYSRRAPRP